MTRVLGLAATWGALAAFVLAAGLAMRGRDRLARRARAAGVVLGALAVGCLVWAFATGDLTLAYVAATSDRATSWPYRIAGVWGGMAGSLLLWSVLTGAWGLLRRDARAGEAAALAVVPAAFLAVVVLWASPWTRLLAPAIDGEGLTPILRHRAMLYHPPLLYLGVTALVVPYAAVLGGAPAMTVRRWLLASWAVITIAMAAGAHWAYVELGWGGYWAWDPVENTALLPWLAALAALHLLRRDSHRPSARAALVLAAGGGFALGVLGTTLTRSGTSPSVHAFAEDPDVGRALLAVAGVGVGALVWRAWRESRVHLAVARAEPRGQHRDVHDEPTSARASGGARAARARRRDAGLRAQPGLVAAVLVVVLIGTVRPAIGSAAVAVDGSFYAAFVAPLAVVAAVVMVVAGVALPRRLGASRPSHLAHVGFLVLLVGVLGSTTGSSEAATLAPGESMRVAGWEIRNDGIAVVTVDGHEAVAADVALLRDGRERDRLQPALVAYPEHGRLLAETGLRSTPLVDVQVALRDADDDGRALLEVHVNPLVWWVWWGAVLLGGAGAWAALEPARRDQLVPLPGPSLSESPSPL